MSASLIKVHGSSAPNAAPLAPSLNIASLVDGGVGHVRTNFTNVFDAGYAVTTGNAHVNDWLSESCNGANQFAGSSQLFMFPVTGNLPIATDNYTRLYFQMAGDLA